MVLFEDHLLLILKELITCIKTTIYSIKIFFLHYGDLTDSSNLNFLVGDIQPDEIYNLGAQSHVAVSFEVPEYTADVDGIGTLRFLDTLEHQKNQ